MSIPASHIVAVSSRVLSGGSADLETNGLLLTKNTLIPAQTPAVTFTTASDVAAMFGAESVEAQFAQQYFTGCENQQMSPLAVVIARRVDVAAPAWIRSASLTVDLADLKKVTDGKLTLAINGEPKSAESVDFSECTSLSECAETLATALTGVTGTYDSNLNAITLTTESTGAEATIDFPSAVAAASVGAGVVGVSQLDAEGTDLGALLGLTQEAGAVISQGAAAMTPSENLDAISSVTRNWVGFTTAYEAEFEEAQGLAAWADINDDYVYFDWTLDEKCLNQLTQSTTKPAQLMENFNCTACIFGDWHEAAFALGIGASIAWDRNQGMKVWFAKATTGISPRITSEAEANALEAIRCSYFGEFATRNAQFDFFNRGTLASTLYGFIDVLYGSIVLRNWIQRSCMDGFKQTNRVPYNARGEALIRAWIQDSINRALQCGIIDAGLELSSSQEAQLMQETADESVVNALFINGYWVGISMPAANARADRGAPTVSVIYAYAGGVQKLDCEVLAVI